MEPQDQDPIQNKNPNPDPTPAKGPPGMPNKPEAWKSALDEAISGRDSAKQRARELEAELNKYRVAEQTRAQKDAEAAAEMEQRRLAEEGKYAEALAQKDQHWQKKIETIHNAMSSRLVPTAISAAAASIPNLTPDALRDLPALLGNALAINPSTFEVFVKGPDGQPLKDAEMNPVSVESYVKQFVTQRPYMLVDKMPASHRAQGGTSKPSQYTYQDALADPKVMKQWEQEDPQGLRAAEEAYNSPAEIKRRAQEQFGIRQANSFQYKR